MKKAKIKKGSVNYKKNNILCIVLKEGKGSTWVWLNEKDDKFTLDGNTYFKLDTGTYLKGNLRTLIFLEGISLPINHEYIEREEETRSYTDRDTGTEKTVVINKIKGLNFDSKVIDMLLNRNLADEFTKQHLDLPNLAIIILLIINVLATIIGSAALYMSLGG